MGVLIWIVLTLFSFIGYLFFNELLWEYVGNSGTIDTIAVIVNFYLCNFIVWILLYKNPIVILNKVIIYLLTGILLLIGELMLGYYILNNLMGLGEMGVLTGMIFVFVVAAAFGGPMSLLGLVLKDLINFNNSFWDGLKQNAIDNAIKKSQEENNRK